MKKAKSLTNEEMTPGDLAYARKLDTLSLSCAASTPTSLCLSNYETLGAFSMCQRVWDVYANADEFFVLPEQQTCTRLLSYIFSR